MSEGNKTTYPRPTREDRSLADKIAEIQQQGRRSRKRYGLHTRSKVRQVRKSTHMLGSDTVLQQLVSATTIQLPTAVGLKGKRYRIEDGSGDATANPITINPLSGQTISGASSIQIDADNGHVVLRSDNANWIRES